MSDRLLTEIQRQQKYLDRLPSGFDFPLFNAKQALLSQRASSYRSTASAAREIVDNSIEAGASRIHIVMDADQQGPARGTIRAVAFIDDGPGMLPKMAQYALSWGGGTHFDDHAFIGRFGFGLPNASISQSKSTEVYTRIVEQEGFTKVRLNIDEYQEEFGKQTIPEPKEDAPLPDFVTEYLDRNNLELKHGTVVVWSNPDKLSHRKVATLKERFIDDFGVTYRYLLNSAQEQKQSNSYGVRQVELMVQGVHVGPVDPLFLLPGGRYFIPEAEGGAINVCEKDIPVRVARNTKSGEFHIRIVHSADLDNVERNDSDNEASDTSEQIDYAVIHVKIARLPQPIANKESSGRKEKTDANKRLAIRIPRRGISYVRAGREIETSDHFPRHKDEGVGRWPAQYSYAQRWGAEVRFTPELDDVFGISNDKQSVHPNEDFWRVLTEAGINVLLMAQQSKVKGEDEARIKAKLNQSMDEERGRLPTPAEIASKNADVASGGNGPRVPDYYRPGFKQRFDELVSRQAAETGRQIQLVEKALEDEAKKRPYVVDYLDEKYAPFYVPDWSDKGQITVNINREHPFFAELYKYLQDTPGGKKVKQVVDLLLIALSRGELTCQDENMKIWYEEQRERSWSDFLKTAVRSLNSIEDTIGAEEMETEETV